jgi:hypothetical protein
VLDTAANSVLKDDPSQPPGAKLTSPATSILAFAGKP